MTAPATNVGSEEETILVIDDDRDGRSTSRLHLETAGYKVTEARDAAEGIELARQRRPDLIVLGVSRPPANGIAICRGLRADSSLQHIPILIWTETDDVQSIAEGFAAGASDILAGPADRTILPHRARLLLRSVRQERDLAGANARAQTNAIALAAMSHEIRTPLNDLIGMIDLLEQSKLDSEQESKISKVRESAFALLNTIADILDFSKIESGELVIEQIESSATTVIEDVIETLLPIARTKNIELVVFTSPRIPNRVVSDPLRMRQILLNLIGNAINFSACNGGQSAKVQIAADIAASDGTGEPVLRFTVSDTSACMSQDRMARLFTPYFQAEDSTLRQFGGTGLGLTISRSLIDLMGGAITVESDVGQGSKFTVDLPFIPIKSDTQEVRNRLRGLRILLAGLDRDLEHAARNYLTHEGAELASAAALEDAERMFADATDDRRPFDVAVIAHTQPQTVDAENAAIAALVASPGCKDTRFILLSDDRRNLTQSALPACTILPKHPLNRTAFLRAIFDAVGQPESAPPCAPEKPDPAKLEVGPAEGLVLLAEDNEINQLVIQRQLEEFGHIADVAADGEQAFEAFQRGNYRLLLADCHMPNMDGFELTRAIREKERETGSRIAIVAITGDTEKEDVARCLSAGMDGFLAKPVELEALGATLNRWLGEDTGPATPETADTDRIPSDVVMYEDMQTDNPIDLAVLARLLGTDDEAYLREMVKAFWNTMRDTTSELNALLNCRDAPKLRDAAHAAKGASASVGAVSVATLLKELQFAATDADWGLIEGLLPRIETEFTKLEEYVDSIQAA